MLYEILIPQLRRSLMQNVSIKKCLFGQPRLRVGGERKYFFQGLIVNYATIAGLGTNNRALESYCLVNLCAGKIICVFNVVGTKGNENMK